MGGNYQKDLFRQLMEVMSKVDSLESEQRQNRQEIKSLTGEVKRLRKENASLHEVPMTGSVHLSIPCPVTAWIFQKEAFIISAVPSVKSAARPITS